MNRVVAAGRATASQSYTVDATAARIRPNSSNILERLPKDVLTAIVCDYLCVPSYDDFGDNDYYDCTDEDEIADHVILSHTCRALRKLVLGLPVLWSRLHSTMGEDELTTYLTRSREAGLSITLHEPLYFDEVQGQFWAFVKTVAKYSHRWIKLELRPADEFWDTDSNFLVRLQDELGQKDVPQLSSLSMKSYYVDGEAFDWDNIEGHETLPAPYFFSTWKMPKLARLLVSEIIPLAEFGASLTTLHIILPENHDGSSLNSLADVISMISSSPALEELFFKTHVRVSNQSFQQRSIPLVSLRHLYIELVEHSFEESPEVTKTFLASLPTPNLISYGCGVSTVVPMRQQLEPGLPGPNPEYIMSFFPTSDKMTGIQHLHIRKGFHMVPHLPLNAVLRRLPRLQSLKITDADLTVELDPPLRDPPALRSICFDHCDLSHDFLKGIVDSLRNSSRWESFEDFRFVFCGGVTRTNIDAIVPLEKLVWKGLVELQ